MNRAGKRGKPAKRRATTSAPADPAITGADDGAVSHASHVIGAAAAEPVIAWRDRLWLALIVALVFARGVTTPLQESWDDGRFIINNPRVRSISWQAFVDNVSTVQFEAFHPLHLLSYWLDVPWFGVSAPIIHGTSVLLWVIASWCVLGAMRGLGLSRWPALLATLICVVHPAQVEVVTWASGRKDILALLFSALVITWHLRAQRFNDRAAWLSRLMFALAALSKTSVACLPLLLMLIDVALSRRKLRSALLQQLPALLLMIGLGALTVLTWQGSHMLGVRADSDAGPVWRWAATVTHHAWMAVWPARNSPMYVSHHWALPSAWHWTGPVIIALISVACARVRNRLALVGALGFVVLLLPSSNLLPMVFPLQDRYASLALLAFALCVGALFEHARFAVGTARSSVLPPSRSMAALGGLIVLSLAARTVQYQGAWQSELGLWQHAASTQPRAYYAWMKLGEVRRDAGLLEESVRAYRSMVSLVPEVQLGHAALFQALVLLDEKRNALPASPTMEYARRFHASLRDPSQLHQLAQLLIARGYDEAAAMALDYALTLQPFPKQVLTQNAERFERERRAPLAEVLRRHEKQSAQ